MSPEIRVSAAVVTDGAGRALVVRKRGTDLFQQPGGKPDPGETALEAVVRELVEETGIIADAASFTVLGEYRDTAANEPGHIVVADAFALVVSPVDAVAGAEIAELRWIGEHDLDATPLAPLSRNQLLPLAWR
ncbi:NUDIX hydrolase [Microbacterium sp. ASV49]|uniref:NUDIX domain-containing protein n=1 Tax=Microbacterium candidum TaxID=3041922 RepID=A0ABT7MX25_9MICO|nr:NUDIX domain-containing protein [Microbacterium sp. ASV49]MDL9978975.1 NUDIX domain-containing protein [Microbacterium sp. ASV49]